MTDRAALIALAERCEAATGPDRGLDAEMHFRITDGVGCGMAQDAPAYTASIDAALMLVPKRRPDGLHLHITKIGYPSGIDRSTASIFDEETHVTSASASTPALAICAAALRAMAEEG